jgi:hypothetical protein
VHFVLLNAPTKHGLANRLQEAPTDPMARKLEDDITWHREQIERLHHAIALGEPAKAAAVKTPAWGPKRGGAAELPGTLTGMRQMLDRFEQTLSELEEQRGRGD